MEDNFEVDKFCALVKTKESIWNYKSQAYGNKLQRRDDWLSICESMIEDFATKSNGEKTAAAIEYQAKWKVLRDGFTRSLKNYQKKSPRDGYRGKLYTYYKQLDFLNDLYDGKEKAIFESRAETSTDVNEDSRTIKRPRKKCSGDDNENKFYCEKHNKLIDKAPRSSDGDELAADKQFLLSLLNDFTKIPSDQKLDAKGDIINVIRHYRSSTITQFQTRGSYYFQDIAALATTATERPSSCEQYFEHTETIPSSPTEIKFVTHA